MSRRSAGLAAVVCGQNSVKSGKGMAVQKWGDDYRTLMMPQFSVHEDSQTGTKGWKVIEMNQYEYTIYGTEVNFS